MTMFALNPTAGHDGQMALAAFLGAAGVVLLLPQPRGRLIPAGIASLLFAAVIAGAWIHQNFGEPAGDAVGKLLFILFSTGAVGFGNRPRRAAEPGSRSDRVRLRQSSAHADCFCSSPRPF